MSALPVGTRVHHRACEYSYGYTPERQRTHPSWGWATILEVVDGPYRAHLSVAPAYEYRVELDAPVLPGGKLESQWPSYHLDKVER